MDRILPIPRPRSAVIELSPSLFLTTWACGLAAVTAVVVSWRVVGPGFGCLSASVTVLFGVAGWAIGGGWAAGAGTILALGAVVGARRSVPAALAAAGSAVFFAVASIPDGGVAPTLSGALALGAITGEMLLGHWYLIDPTLARWALKRLAAAGAVGIVADAAVLALVAGFDPGGTVTGWAYLALGLTTLVLMVAVWFALDEPSYPGVMAATGLSYLAILTAIGAAVAGRALTAEDGGLLGAGVLLDTIAPL